MSDVEQPEHAAYRQVKHERGFTQCGKCKRVLQNAPTFRCPYVACREWLIGFGDAQPERNKRDRAREDAQ
jgi:hypothetical protein